ncbi:MAG TPA: hypothetical protein VI488_16940 [Candidatus Angelobacter sp.]
MNRKRVVIIASILLAFGVFYYFYGGGSTPKGQSPLTSLKAANMSTLKEAFNNSASSVRVLVMLSPT